jgi:hypothetical protein
MENNIDFSMNQLGLILNLVRAAKSKARKSGMCSTDLYGLLQIEDRIIDHAITRNKRNGAVVQGENAGFASQLS